MTRWLIVLSVYLSTVASLAISIFADDQITPWAGRWGTVDKNAARKTTREIISIDFAKNVGILWAEIEFSPEQLIGGGIGEEQMKTHSVSCVCDGRETTDGGLTSLQAMFAVSGRAITVTSTYILETAQGRTSPEGAGSRSRSPRSLAEQRIGEKLGHIIAQVFETVRP